MLSGPASLDMVVAGHGQQPARHRPSLTGKGSIHLDQGAIQGVQILDTVQTATKFLTLGLAGGGDKTEFDRFDASYVITNGVLTSQDLKLTSSDLPVIGEGTVDLPQAPGAVPAHAQGHRPGRAGGHHRQVGRSRLPARLLGAVEVAVRREQRRAAAAAITNYRLPAKAGIQRGRYAVAFDPRLRGGDACGKRG